MHIVLYPLPVPTLVFERGMKFQKKWAAGANFKKICTGNQKGEGRGNAKVIGN